MLTYFFPSAKPIRNRLLLARIGQFVKNVLVREKKKRLCTLWLPSPRIYATCVAGNHLWRRLYLLNSIVASLLITTVSVSTSLA